MKRIIKDYTNVTEEQLKLITTYFPDGIDSDHVISFTGLKGEYIKAIEVKTPDTIYLFKISSQMLAKIDAMTDDDFDMSDFGDYLKSDGTFSGPPPAPKKPAKKAYVQPDDPIVEEEDDAEPDTFGLDDEDDDLPIDEKPVKAIDEDEDEDDDLFDDDDADADEEDDKDSDDDSDTSDDEDDEDDFN
jgi:DNA-directed RNA polymerase subunit delta